LPPAYGRGPTAVYDADHLLRLRYIQQLKATRLPLGEIRERLNSLSAEDLAIALRIETEPSAETWRHYRLHEDLEIVVRDRPTGSAPDARGRGVRVDRGIRPIRHRGPQSAK
jgi:DNA-binding transcriptional MerR regulator